MRLVPNTSGMLLDDLALLLQLEDLALILKLEDLVELRQCISLFFTLLLFVALVASINKLFLSTFLPSMDPSCLLVCFCVTDCLMEWTSLRILSGLSPTFLGLFLLSLSS